MNVLVVGTDTDAVRCIEEHVHHLIDDDFTFLTISSLEDKEAVNRLCQFIVTHYRKGDLQGVITALAIPEKDRKAVHKDWSSIIVRQCIQGQIPFRMVYGNDPISWNVETQTLIEKINNLSSIQNYPPLRPHPSHCGGTSAAWAAPKYD